MGAAVVIAALLLGVGAVAAVVVMNRAAARQPVGLCRLETNDAYRAIARRTLGGYWAAGQAAGNDAVASVADVAAYGLAPLFQMRACSVNALDLTTRLPDGLRSVIHDPEHHSGALPAAPIDIEVAWYAELGVDGLIAGWSTIARLDLQTEVGELQRLLGLGLAHATNPDRGAVLAAGQYPDFLIDKDRYLGYSYTVDFIDFGESQVELARYARLSWAGSSESDQYLRDDPAAWRVEATGPRVYGWSVLAPLLRFGDFHEAFLTPVATAIIEFDRQRRGDWSIEGEQWVSFDAFEGSSTDAMPAVLEALRHNPAAAEAVLAATGDERVADLLSEI
ncbi:MAG TPA: hypothetical protein VIL37_17545 [Natronosporangium sp.]